MIHHSANNSLFSVSFNVTVSVVLDYFNVLDGKVKDLYNLKRKVEFGG